MATIKEIQTKLKALGYYTGAIDGISGPYTLAAIKAFQKAKGLLVDGIVGPVTLKALGLLTTSTSTSVPTSTFGMGYFIDPASTPISGIDFAKIKAKGITEVYVRVKNADYTTWAATLTKIKAAGLKPFVWVWQGFSYVKYMATQGWNICMDMEKYDMANYYSEIQAVRAASQGKTFILCTKADVWDGNQQWAVIKNYCDYLMPMLYLGDYGKTVAQLAAYMKDMNTKYPGKIYPVLETYVSDANVVAKTTVVLQSEIAAVKPYCKGLGLFRYGISNL